MSPQRIINPLVRYMWLNWRLPLAMVSAAVLMIGVFAYRAWQTAATDTKLCEVLVQIVEDGDSALDGITYYQAHPDELAAAHARNHAVIRQLNCGSLPSG